MIEIRREFYHPMGIRFIVELEDIGSGRPSDMSGQPRETNRKRVTVQTSSSHENFKFFNSRPEDMQKVGEALAEIGKFVQTL